MSCSIMMKNIPDSEKPRERLLNLGANSIATEELIAIILKTGTKEESVKHLSEKVLSLITSMSDLKDISVHRLTSIKGIGPVKAIELLAAIELGRRVYCETNLTNRTTICNPNNIYHYFKNRIQDTKQEHFYCLYLDSKNKLIEQKLIFKGTLNASLVHPREVFKWAHILSANSIICVHNHPSGNAEPSKEDIDTTQKLKMVGTIQGIKLQDHIIIGDNQYYSFYEQEKI